MSKFLMYPVPGATPGEWWVRTREVDGEVVDCFVAAKDCQGIPYDAEILGDDEYRDGIERKLADARLIASAPDLYAALSRALSWLSSYQGGGAMEAYEQARAAIDKAEGKA